MSTASDPVTPIVAAASTQKAAVKRTTRRVKVISRKGVKVQEDEAEEEEGVKVAGEDPASDTDSEFAPEDDDSESESEAVELPTPAAVATPAPPATLPTTHTTAVVRPIASTTSWSDSPAVGELGADDLPVLDFATLTPAALDAVPIVIKGSAAAAAAKVATASKDKVVLDGPSKKALMLARREAKSAAAKEKDPVAWEAAEVVRKELELQKKKEKRERIKEKTKEKRLAAAGEAKPVVAAVPRVAAPAAATARTPIVPLPSTSTSTSTSTPTLPPTGPRNSARPPRVALSRPSRTSIALAANAAASTAPAASTSTLPPRGPSNSFNNQYTEERAASTVSRSVRGREGEPRRGGSVARGGVARGRGGRSNGGDAGWVEEEKKVVDVLERIKVASATRDPEQEEDDGWGRGEAKREIKSSVTPANFPLFPDAVSGWNHDGYQEMMQEDASRTASRGRGGMQGGGRGRGGINVNLNSDRPVPGSINPKYANLPFHPHHRYPGSVESKASLPAGATNSRPSAGESQLFDESSNVVRLPGAVAVSVPVVSAPVSAPEMVPAKAGVSLPEVVVNMGPSTAAPRSPSPIPVVYPVVPVPASAPTPVEVQQSSAPPPPFQQQPPQQPSYYQLPPHLQSQSNSFAAQPPQQQQQQYITRHASPAYYPQFYSPDSSFPNMPPPGTTPPPLFPGPQPGTFFVPPRQSKIEIKAPRPGQPPSSYPKSALSASGNAFAPRESNPYSSPYQSRGSPVSSRDGMISPSPYYGGGAGYGQQSAGAMDGYIPVESGGIVYFVKPTQQMQAPSYYDPYSNGGGYASQHHQVDPAILSMSNGGSSGYYPQQQQQRGPSSYYQQQQQGMMQGGMGNGMQNGGGGQSFPLPPPAQYRSDGY